MTSLVLLRAEVAERALEHRQAREREEAAAAEIGTPENVARFERARDWSRNRAEAEREARSRLIHATHETEEV